MEYEPDANYPKDLLCSTQGTKLKFKRITFESLRAACRVGFKGISSDNWSKETLKLYLKTEGLNTAIIEMIQQCGLLQKIYLSIEHGTSNFSKKQIEIHQKEQKLHPDCFPHDKLPPF